MRLVLRIGIIALAAATAAAYEPLPQDTGAAGTWQKLQKLRTIASVMHTTAHPDDEHGGLLAWLSRGVGARVSLMTLNRGQSGDNALGPQLFDGLGLIRTEELLRADQYYGVDAQYFTDVIDYGFSKRLEEALDKWGRESVLRDLVRSPGPQYGYYKRVDTTLTLPAKEETFFDGIDTSVTGMLKTLGRPEPPD